MKVVHYLGKQLRNSTSKQARPYEACTSGLATDRNVELGSTKKIAQEESLMNIIGYETGPIACKAAFTADFDMAAALPLQQIVTNLEVGRK